ncbi:MAG: ADP-ribosylglycohydrolase family protein [Candidatus Melainabacteria bacterium]|jgi:ADP-ribosylglycohydrolase|nr:ADP-ribosylglycohydrolase family protein [Candidatus Melainabacteria bacterium]
MPNVKHAQRALPIRLRKRFRGALLGLAAGDAVGTTLEFTFPGTFEPITNMVGGGPFELEPGQWTDDTSMALCLAASLVECDGFNAIDQMKRYVFWWREGYMSSTGTCFDIGNTVSAALSKFERNPAEAFHGSTDPMTAGNGSLMRLAPVPLAFYNDPENAIAMAAQSSRTTHGAAVAVDACRYMTALIVGALNGASKEELLSPMYSPVEGYWQKHPLCNEIAEIAAGSFKTKEPPAIRGSGYAAHSLEATLWAFHKSNDFVSGVLLAANLGEDADTTAAIFGQLAGAFYGIDGIPFDWVLKLAKRDEILRLSDDLYEMSHCH